MSRNVKPTPAQIAFREGLIACMRQHGDALDATELLAVACHLVGQLIAMQDQRKYTLAKVMEMVSANIEQGNAEVIDGLLNSTGGTA